MTLQEVVESVTTSQTRRSLLGMLDTDVVSVMNWAMNVGFVDVNALSTPCECCGTVHENWQFKNK